MIQARVRLFGLLRAFVEQQLCGMVTWNDVVTDQGVPSEPKPNGRRNPQGPFKEIATIRFGDYELTVKSPDAHPPLGWITLECETGTVIGPLDQSTWDSVGRFIQKRGMTEHGERTRATPDGWLPGPG